MQSNEKLIASGLWWLALAFGGTALGQGPRSQPRPVLLALDTDHDGKLSAAEIQAAPKSLATLDRNQDGRLTDDEYLAPPEANGASADELVQQFMAFDKNGDGILEASEVPARMQNLFKRGDTNHDGKLTPDEIRAMANRQGMPAGNPSLPFEHGISTANDPILYAIDTNHDGIISAAELAASSVTLLDLDKNHDGVITPEEMSTQVQTPEERMNRMLAEFDTNHDGRIAKSEVPERMQTQFDAIDANHDGYLDKDEMIQYYSNPANTAPRQGGGPSRVPNQEGRPQ
jgi:Ca2+-binding EF-hand superfamily protein